MAEHTFCFAADTSLLYFERHGRCRQMLGTVCRWTLGEMLVGAGLQRAKGAKLRTGD